jgi:hypothetical protein
MPSGSLWVKLFFVVWIGIISYISYGKSSYLFVLLWHYMPGFSSLRVWGRLNIILVPVFAWLLSIAYSHFAGALRNNAGGGLGSVAAKLGIVTAVYAVVLGVQLYLHLGGIRNVLWTYYFGDLLANEKWFIFYGAAAFVVILLIMIVGTKVHLGRGRLSVVAALLILVATVEMRHTGTKIWSYQLDTVPERFQLDVAKIDELSFMYARTPDIDTITLGPIFNVGILENWYFSRYVSFMNKTVDEKPAVIRILLGVQDGQKIFFSESIEYPSIELFLQDSSRYGKTGQLISYNGDELQWEIDAPTAGYLSFIDNWDPDWKAWVDGQPVKIELLFGTFKSVRLTPGKHKVRFSYQPGLFPAVEKKPQGKSSPSTLPGTG